MNSALCGRGSEGCDFFFLKPPSPERHVYPRRAIRLADRFESALARTEEQMGDWHLLCVGRLLNDLLNEVAVRSV